MGEVEKQSVEPVEREREFVQQNAARDKGLGK